jgi:WLM domain
MPTPSLSNYIGYFLAVVLICVVVWIIKTQANEYYLQNDPMLITLKEIIRPIKWEGKSISEGLKLYRGKKSYTINKENTYMCLYDEKGEYYPLNMLLHVLLHEISHSKNQVNIGHSKEFYDIFQQLSDQAEELGIYNSKIPIIDDYCLYAGDDE